MLHRCGKFNEFSQFGHYHKKQFFKADTSAVALISQSVQTLLLKARSVPAALASHGSLLEMQDLRASYRSAKAQVMGIQ